MKTVIENLKQELEIRTIQYNNWSSTINRADRNFPIESLEKMEREIQEYSQAIKVLTKHIEK